MRSKQKFGRFVPLLCAVLALLCGVLRMRELPRGFEVGTGLAISGAPSILILRLAVILSLLCCLVLSLFVSPRQLDYRARYVEGKGSVVLLVGMALLALAGPADLVLTRLSGGTVPLSRKILMIFSVLAGVLGLLSLLR